MNKLTRALTGLLMATFFYLPTGSIAEDIDIFTGLSGSSAGKPNILFVLDNTSNWSRAAQKWPGGLQQGQAEARAIKSLVNESNVSSNINFGLMEFVTNGNANDIGGIVRFPIQSMTAANKTTFGAQLDDIFNNVTSPDEKRNSGTPYGTLLYDVRNYLTGSNTVWAKTSLPGALVGTTQGSNGYTTNYTKFKSPLDATDNCGRTFMVFIGNPSSSGPSVDDATNRAALVALGGDATSLPLPLFTTAPSSVSSTYLGYTPACVASTSACTPDTYYPAECGAAGTYDYCSCQGTNVLHPPKAVQTCPAGLASYFVQSGNLVNTNAATSCAASAPAGNAATAAAATPALTCPAGATCTYSVNSSVATTCSGTNPTPTTGNTSCLTSAPAATAATATSVGLSCPSGSTCSYGVNSGTNCSAPAPTAGTTACVPTVPTANAATAAAATPSLSCPAGSACTYSIDAGTACSSPSVATGTTSCLAAAPVADATTATSVGLSCPAGSTCAYSLDSGTTCASPGASSGTTACLAPAAAPTANAAGGALAGLSCPSGFTCSYAVSAPNLPQCGAPPNASGTTTACLASPPTTDAAGGILAGLTCPSGATCAYTVDSSTACFAAVVTSGSACLASAPGANAAGATLVGLTCPANSSCAYSVATGTACGTSGVTNGTTSGLVSAPAATAAAAGARAGLTCPATSTCTYSVGSGTNTAATTATTSYLSAAPTCTNGAASCSAGGATLTCSSPDAAGSAVSCNYSVSLLSTASVSAAAPVTTGTLVTAPTCTNGAASCSAGGVTSTCPANGACSYAVSAGISTAASTGTTGYLSSAPTANAATAATVGLTCPATDSSGAAVTCTYAVALASTATGAGTTGTLTSGTTNYTANCYSAVGASAGQWNLATTTDFGPFASGGTTDTAFPTCTPSTGCTYTYAGALGGSTSEGTHAGSIDNCGSGTALVRLKQTRTAKSTYTVTMTPNTKTYSITQTATGNSNYTLSMTPNTKTYPVTQTAVSAYTNYTVTQTPTAFRQYTMTQIPTLVSGTNTYTVTQTPIGTPKRYVLTQTPTPYRAYTVTQTPALSPQTKIYTVTQTPTLIPSFSYPVTQAATTWTDLGYSQSCTATSAAAATTGYTCGNLGCRIDATRTNTDSGTACGAGTLSYPVFGDIPGDQVVTPTGQYLTTANTWYADEWAKFLHNTSITSPSVVYHVAGYGAITPGSGGADGKFDLKFTGGVGTTATGTFTVVGGKLTAISIQTLGTYTTAPTAFDFSNSAGLSGASAAVVSATTVYQVTGHGAITAGSGGTDGTYPLAFTGGTGSSAIGTFTVAGGKLTEVSVTTGGTYATRPTAFDFSASGGLTGAASSVTTAALDLSNGGGVTTYAIDVFNAQQNAQQTELLLSMAQQGGGRYYQAKSEQDILTALRNILAEIQSVNTSFAAASIPLSTSNRARNLSEVYIGMFRADPNAGPRWLGNMKKYKLGKIDGVEHLLDKYGIDAGNSQTGFINECATSDWTSDSGDWWSKLNQPITPSPQSECTAMPAANTSVWSDLPDGSSVEKGAVAEVIRKGNNPAVTNTTPTWQVNRTVKTRAISSNAFSNITSGDNSVFDFTRGVDVNEVGHHTAEQNYVPIITPVPTSPVRPSVHGDVVHSRPLAVDYGAAYDGVTIYYGANDGAFRAVNGLTGQERWAFIPSEFNGRLQRLEDNLPLISYPNVDPLLIPTPAPKDYFFDGSTGLRQNIDNTKVWIYPTQRRGGRMIYGIDVTNPNSPTMKWHQGCPTNLMTNPASGELCTTGFDNIGQTWASPVVVRIKGYSTTVPVVIVGGGYDTCEDQNTKSPSCSGTKGNLVYIIDSDTGALLATFPTRRAVTADVSTIDLNGDGLADYAYVTDLGGNIYRISFIDNTTDHTALDKTQWTIKRVAYANSDGGGRKFMFAPALLASGSTGVYVALGSGDRERPLYSDYPFGTVVNRAYAYLDIPDAYDLKTVVVPVNDATNVCDLDGSAAATTACVRDLTTATTCDTEKLLASSTRKAWRVDLEKPGEQTVTPAIVIGGMVTFNTNRPLPPAQATCNLALGEGGGYFLNLLNASGAVAVSGNCSSTINGSNSNRRAVFVAGIGFPTPPVMVSIPGEDPICIGCANKDTGTGGKLFDPIKVSPSFTAKRARKYRYQEIDE